MESKNLRIIEDHSTRPLVAAPPTITLARNGTEYLCGYCQTLLLIAEPGELKTASSSAKIGGRYNEQI